MEEFESIDIHRAKEMIDQGEIILVDIRDPESYKQAHIKSSVLVNDSNLSDFLRNADRNKSLICYCYHGFTSQSAAQFFKQQGFREVYSIEGGFEEYRKVYL